MTARQRQQRQTWRRDAVDGKAGVDDRLQPRADVGRGGGDDRDLPHAPAPGRLTGAAERHADHGVVRLHRRGAASIDSLTPGPRLQDGRLPRRQAQQLMAGGKAPQRHPAVTREGSPRPPPGPVRRQATWRRRCRPGCISYERTRVPSLPAAAPVDRLRWLTWTSTHPVGDEIDSSLDHRQGIVYTGAQRRFRRHCCLPQFSAVRRPVGRRRLAPARCRSVQSCATVRCPAGLPVAGARICARGPLGVHHHRTLGRWTRDSHESRIRTRRRLTFAPRWGACCSTGWTSSSPTASRCSRSAARSRSTPRYCERLGQLLLQLLAAAVRDGQLEARTGFVSDLQHLAAERSLSADRLFAFVYLIERTALDELALSDSLGATSEPWPLVAQLVRRGSFDVVAAYADRCQQNPSGAVLIDRLTTLYSRAVMDVVLANEVQRSDRFNFPLALIVFDVDRLSDINSNYGYGVGDRVLERLGILIHRVPSARTTGCSATPRTPSACCSARPRPTTPCCWPST